MKKSTCKSIVLLTATLLSASFVGCGGNQEETPPTSSIPTDAAGLRGKLVAAQPFPDAIPVGQARREFQPEQEITIVGQVGGTVDPISRDFASFVMADEQVYFCDEMPEETCPAPWDACCEDPETLMANRASVLFLDENGEPLRGDLQDAFGLQGLDRVAVQGVVAPGSSSENLILHASGIYLY